MHVFSFHTEVLFGKITVILILTFQALHSLQYLPHVLGSWVRMGQEIRAGLGHGGITCVVQTQFF